MRKLVITAVFGLSVFSAWCFLCIAGQDQEGVLRVVFMDVGQGDAILVTAPDGQNILIDGGPGRAVLYSLPVYLGYWDRAIDLVILTHAHDDHVAGLIDILGRYDVGKIIQAEANYDSPAYEAWKEAVFRKNIPVENADRPVKISLGEDCELEIIYPSEPAYSIDNPNNASVVSLLDCEGSRFLFTGDIEEEAEKDILASGRTVKADVLKAPHHGSDTSLTKEFLEAVGPRYAVISVGENDYGHPSLRTVSRLERSGAKIIRTDKSGDIVFRTEAYGVLSPEFDGMLLDYPR